MRQTVFQEKEPEAQRYKSSLNGTSTAETSREAFYKFVCRGGICELRLHSMR